MDSSTKMGVPATLKPGLAPQFPKQHQKFGSIVLGLRVFQSSNDRLQLRGLKDVRDVLLLQVCHGVLPSNTHLEDCIGIAPIALMLSVRLAASSSFA